DALARRAIRSLALDPVIQERTQGHQLLAPRRAHVASRLIRDDRSDDGLGLVADRIGRALQSGDPGLELLDPRFEHLLIRHVVPPTSARGIPNWILSVRSSNVAPCVGA